MSIRRAREALLRDDQGRHDAVVPAPDWKEMLREVLSEIPAVEADAVEEERRKIVAWMQATAVAYGTCGDLAGKGIGLTWSIIADLVEAGEHDRASVRVPQKKS